MRTDRLDQRRELRLERAAGLVGQSLSGGIRQAGQSRVDIAFSGQPAAQCVMLVDVESLVTIIDSDLLVYRLHGLVYPLHGLVYPLHGLIYLLHGR